MNDLMIFEGNEVEIILNEKEDKILSSMSIDKFIGHKVTKLNISNIISDLLSNHYQTKNSLANIRFTPSYKGTKVNLKDKFIKLTKKNKIKEAIDEEKREKYHSRCMTYSATMQRRSKYRAKLTLKTSPSYRCLTRPVHINEIGGKRCCQKLYNNYTTMMNDIRKFHGEYDQFLNYYLYL